jgi:hypothetical protein
MQVEIEDARRELSEGDFAHYQRCREKGSSHNMAMILASGKAPGSDRTDERWRLTRDPEAHARGLKGPGKYQPGLARFPGDPEAVVSSRGDAERVAKKRGWTITKEPNNAGKGVQRGRAGVLGTI